MTNTTKDETGPYSIPTLIKSDTPLTPELLDTILSQLVQYNVLTINAREALLALQGQTTEGIPVAVQLLSKTLITAIGKDVEYSFEAGKTLPDELYISHQELIIAGITRSPIKSAYTGKEWPRARLEDALPQLQQAVLKDARASYIAGRDWHEEYFSPIIEQAGAVIERVAEWSYHAGLDWSDERFRTCQHNLEKGVISVPRYTRQALGRLHVQDADAQPWPENRKKALEDHLNILQHL